MAEETKPQGYALIANQMKEVIELKESFKEEQVKFIKNMLNPDLTDNELYMFLLFASKAGLNPFNKEIIAVVYSKNDPAKRRVSTIVARDGKRAVAERKGGIEKVETKAIYTKEVTIETEQDGKVTQTIVVKPWEGGKLWGATCTVVRNGKAFTAEVPFSEYTTGRDLWAAKPSTMIKKVAESQALSMAVPELLGAYDESEMPNEPAQVAAALVEGGDKEVAKDDPLMATLKVLGGDMNRTYTRQEANDEIMRLTAEKGKKKKAEVAEKE